MDEDLRSASQSVAESDNQPAYASKAAPPGSKNHKQKKPALLAGGGALLILAVCTAWFFLQKPKPASAPAVTTQVKTTVTEPTKDVPDADASETYSSSALSVGFKYPKSWKVSEANGGIRIESPLFEFSSVQLGTQKGNFRIYIRQGARKVDGTYIGRGVAIKPSEKLTYTQPAVGQRTETLLSSFGIDSSDYFSFFLIAGNFQLNKGDTLGPDYGKEPDTYIITGGYALPTATDDLATLPVDNAYYATTNAYKQAYAIIGSLQLK